MLELSEKLLLLIKMTSIIWHLMFLELDFPKIIIRTS